MRDRIRSPASSVSQPTRQAIPRVLVAIAFGACASAGPQLLPPPNLLDTDVEQRRIASRVRVVGIVGDASEAPVANARVFVQAYTGRQCRGGRAAEGAVRSRADGWYIKTLYFYSMLPTTTCISVRVDPEPESALAADSITDLLAQFRHGGDIDTVVVRFALKNR